MRPTQSKNLRGRTLARRPSKYHQLGFLSLGEVALVLVIIIIAAVIGLPAIKGTLIEMRVPAVADELQRFMSRTRVLGEGDSVTPYASVSNEQNLVPALRDSSVFKVTDTTVSHRLGGSGVGTDGTISLAPAALGGGAMGSAFSLTLTNVNIKACPVLASTLNAVSETMSVNGTTVKALGDNNDTGSYNPVTAQNLCTKGDSNTFVFATR
ncbi:type 4 pilus major pilin [Bordetella bronchialis]|uniref:type 4 pilus major pilin n=1 Tax=Bordetella bronchialis TaxID=463025 RepID=UPI0009F6E2C9|nr:type 4 pilus major pilin [Bordetella bronchialis]